MNLLYANDRRGEYPNSWYAATAEFLDPLPPLKGHHKADLCVIGAGFTGLSAALHAAKAGLKVIVLDAQRVGFGASGRNGGQVGTGFNKSQQELEKQCGKDVAKALWALSQEAKALTTDLCRQYAQDALIKPGIAHVQYHAGEVREAHQHAEYLFNHYGYDQINLLDQGAVQELIGSPQYHGGILDTGAFHLHPLRYALGLARACLKVGVQIFETSPVHNIQPGSPLNIQTEAGIVTADHAIIATNGYGTYLSRKTTSRVMPINNFIVATEPLNERSSSILSQDIAVADSKFVVNYFRLSHDNRLLFGGGESYGYKFPQDLVSTVRKPMEKVFPQLNDVKIDYAWGGTLAITMSRLPLIGRVGPNITAASGYSGHGVALAGLAGKVLADALTSESHALDVLQKLPTRPFPGGGAFRTPLLALAMTWYAIRDRIGV